MSCQKQSAGSGPYIATLDCSTATFTGTPINGTSFTGTAFITYTSGNGEAYNAGTAIISTGITGLTATVQAGTLTKGAGDINVSVTGTASAAGSAKFAITFLGKSCTMALTVL